MSKGEVVGFRRVRGRVIPIRRPSGEGRESAQASRAEALLKAGGAAAAQGAATAGAWYGFGKRLANQKAKTARILDKVQKQVIKTPTLPKDLFGYANYDPAYKLARKAAQVRRVRLTKLTATLNTQRAVLKSVGRFGPAAVGISALLAGTATYLTARDGK